MVTPDGQMPSNALLAARLRQTSFELPDLHAGMAHWPKGRSTLEHGLRIWVNEYLDAFPLDTKRLKVTKAANIGLFVSTWWPFASYDRMQVAAFLNVWLFLWDDETDTTEHNPDLASNFAAAQAFREQTLAYVYQKLGEPFASGDEKSHANVCISAFSPVAAAVHKSFSHGQKTALVHEIERWIQATAVEQKHSFVLPSVEMYLAQRLGSSATGVVLAILDYMLGFDLPDVLRQDPEVSQLLDLANAIISIQNDILSLRRELGHGWLNNMCVLLYMQHGDLQLAIDDANGRVTNWIAELDRTGDVLTARYAGGQDPYVRGCVRRYIEGCKVMGTGNITWSYGNGRYGLTADGL